MGNDPHWIVGVLFAVALLGTFIGAPLYIFLAYSATIGQP